MINCKRTAELVSRSLDRPLGLWRGLLLGLHLAFCGRCCRFRRQSGLLQRAGRLVGQGDRTGAAADDALSVRARERIKQALQRQAPGGPA
jgi:hypothetical protein